MTHRDWLRTNLLLDSGDGEHDVLDYLKCDSEIHWALVAVCAKEFGCMWCYATRLI
jgi:hypothetical protein